MSLDANAVDVVASWARTASDALPLVRVESGQSGRKEPVLLLEDVLAQQEQACGNRSGQVGSSGDPPAASPSTLSIS